jgi:hypothetical protein
MKAETPQKLPVRPSIIISQDIFDEANRFADVTRVSRTQASKHDTLTGNLGELVFAQYFFGDFRRHLLGQTKGKTDFPNIEIKTSAHPFRETLHLPIRIDYEERRRPPFYVLVILDVEKPKSPPQAGCKAILCGYCSWEEARQHGREIQFAAENGGFACLCVPMKFLHPMGKFLGSIGGGFR